MNTSGGRSKISRNVHRRPCVYTRRRWPWGAHARARISVVARSEGRKRRRGSWGDCGCPGAHHTGLREGEIPLEEGRQAIIPQGRVTDTQGCNDVAGWETCKLEEGHELAGMTEDNVAEAIEEMADALEENSGLFTFRLKKPDRGENFMKPNLGNLHFRLAPEVGHRIDQMLKRNIVRVHVGMCVRVCGGMDVATMLNVEGTLLHVHTSLTTANVSTAVSECSARTCECLAQCDSYMDATR